MEKGGATLCCRNAHDQNVPVIRCSGRPLLFQLQWAKETADDGRSREARPSVRHKKLGSIGSSRDLLGRAVEATLSPRCHEGMRRESKATIDLRERARLRILCSP